MMCIALFYTADALEAQFELQEYHYHPSTAFNPILHPYTEFESFFYLYGRSYAVLTNKQYTGFEK